jgi:stress-induced morphogen
MQVEQKIKEKLEAAFAPDRLLIENDSHKHAHHTAMKGVANTGETHFTVTIISSAFAGRSRIDRQRMVYAALAEELAGPIHALGLKVAAPGELGNA